MRCLLKFFDTDYNITILFCVLFILFDIFLLSGLVLAYNAEVFVFFSYVLGGPVLYLIVDPFPNIPKQLYAILFVFSPILFIYLISLLLEKIIRYVIGLSFSAICLSDRKRDSHYFISFRSACKYVKQNCCPDCCEEILDIEGNEYVEDILASACGCEWTVVRGNCYKKSLGSDKWLFKLISCNLAHRENMKKIGKNILRTLNRILKWRT